MAKARDTVDLVVLGSGAAGLTAALVASLQGLDVLVLEHQSTIGGTSARSSGTVWIPGSHFLRAEGISDDRARAEDYLSALVADRGEETMWRAFLQAGPAMLKDLEARAGLGFRPFTAAPDYRQDCPGAAPGGRALEPMPFDGRLLAEDFERLGSPLSELMLWGGMMVTRAEAAQLLRADRSLSAAWLGARMVGRFLRDRLTWSRGTRLVLGNALIARLLHALRSRDVPVRTGVRTQELVLRGERVTGVSIVERDEAQYIEARRGVVLAGGGFPASETWREELLPRPVPVHTPASPGADGSTLELALAAGAALGPTGLDNGLWFPSSIGVRPDGSKAVYPHIVLDRSKPGLIAVNAAGMRFTNEAVSYHEFVRAMYGVHDQSSGIAPSVPAWLVVDRAFLRKYGLGMIRPRAPSLRKYLRSGYLKTGRNVVDLARETGLPPQQLAATIERYNALASRGVDEDFHKGETIYDRSNGDASHGPNPCMRPIGPGSLYAVQVWPTPLGTSRGLRADTHARVLDGRGEVIDGLYVCGNDMQSAFGGEYPGAGAQLGQAMTFGWVAARHAAGLSSVSTADAQGEERIT